MERAHLLVTQLGQAAGILAGDVLGDRYAFDLSLSEHLALGLSDRSDDVQDQPRGEIPSVGAHCEALGGELDGHSPSHELLHDREHVAQRAGEAVNRGDDERVPLADVVQGLSEPTALGGGGSGLVLTVVLSTAPTASI